MDAATDAFNEGASEGMRTRTSQAPRTSSGSPEPSAPMQMTSLPRGRFSGLLPAAGTAAARPNPASAAVARKSADASSEGVRRTDGRSNVSGILNPVQKYDAPHGGQKFCGAYVEERKDPGRAGRGLERRNATQLLHLVENLQRWGGSLLERGGAFSDEEVLDLAMLFGLELRSPLARDCRGSRHPVATPRSWRPFRHRLR